MNNNRRAVGRGSKGGIFPSCLFVGRKLGGHKMPFSKNSKKEKEEGKVEKKRLASLIFSFFNFFLIRLVKTGLLFCLKIVGSLEFEHFVIRSPNTENGKNSFRILKVRHLRLNYDISNKNSCHDKTKTRQEVIRLPDKSRLKLVTS